MLKSIRDKIKFYVNPEWRISDVDHTFFLYPFWGISISKDRIFNLKLFKKFNFKERPYEIVNDIRKCHFVLAPYRYAFLKKKPSLFNKYLKKARKFNKPLLLDDTGDIAHHIKEKDVYVLRIGGYRHDKKNNEIYFPPFADDLLEEYYNGELQIRNKKFIATVGFSGWSLISKWQFIKFFIKEIPTRLLAIYNDNYITNSKGVFWRIKANKILEKSDIIRTNFIKRKSYSAHTATAEKKMEILRKEFVENLINSDYALCVRGDANSATRFYEALSLGRIPVILDTNWIFPFEEAIDYGKFSLIVNFRDLNNLDKIINNFHRNISNDDFIKMQKLARLAFVDYFRLDSLINLLVTKLWNIRNEIKGV